MSHQTRCNLNTRILHFLFLSWVDLTSFLWLVTEAYPVGINFSCQDPLEMSRHKFSANPITLQLPNQLGNTSREKKCFLSSIARMRGGEDPARTKKYTLYIHFLRPKKMYKLPKMGWEVIRAMPERKVLFFKDDKASASSLPMTAQNSTHPGESDLLALLSNVFKRPFQQ